jgi:hypothetical protein
MYFATQASSKLRDKPQLLGWVKGFDRFLRVFRMAYLARESGSDDSTSRGSP